jgi:hypothetical protein
MLPASALNGTAALAAIERDQHRQPLCALRHLLELGG